MRVNTKLGELYCICISWKKIYFAAPKCGKKKPAFYFWTIHSLSSLFLLGHCSILKLQLLGEHLCNFFRKLKWLVLFFFSPIWKTKRESKGAMPFSIHCKLHTLIVKCVCSNRHQVFCITEALMSAVTFYTTNISYFGGVIIRCLQCLRVTWIFLFYYVIGAF